ncbi:hypothetical protein ATJ97_1384 [Georgenia soli]|uniref:ATP synthase F subunit n=1 Tax=Georgenia soli TaxID=638953 RepID=A0A2A9EIX7_9MICO|nr:hypothetical protein [Georgenia soli]PFG38894.1 hypothetical protein ATJ97_1384 [Georgenia soli]
MTGRVAVLGEGTAVSAFALAGALVLPADDDAAVRSAWAVLPADVEVVVLTAAAAQALGPVHDRPLPLTVVMPEAGP